MKPYWTDRMRTVLNADAVSGLRSLEAESVQCCVTSPPYWGLRKYKGDQDLIWGGENHHEHEWVMLKRQINQGGAGKEQDYGIHNDRDIQTNTCSLCGAWRGAYGLEPTVDMYVQHTVEILREIRRVLRKDGCLFLNLGDSYAGSGKGIGSDHGKAVFTDADIVKTLCELPAKNLCLIPFRVALAAQQPYQEFTIKALADRAWLAGIIDGEGTIGIHHYERTDGQGYHYHQFQPFIGMGSSDLCMVEHCAAITRMGGSRQKTEPGYQDSRGIKSRRAHYEWRLEGEQAIKVIEDIYPYLILKERQARIAYALWHLKGASPHTRQDRPVPQEITDEKLRLWQLCKACNQRQDVTVNLPAVPQHIEPGWYVRSVIVWSKPNPMPESVTDRPTESHEYILMLTKSERYYWDQEAVKEESIWQPGDREDVPRGGFNGKYDNGEFAGSFRAIRSSRNLRSVWTFPTHGFSGAHFATFPEELPERCIKAASREGDTVLDPFAGSGTTLLVAARLGRKSVGIEISKEYCELIVDRNRQGVLG